MTNDVELVPVIVAETSFQREERFIVIKRKHLTPFMESAIRNQLAALEVPTVECVVVESDWPEYETVWKMIEDRVTGRTRTASADSGEALKEALKAAYRKGATDVHEYWLENPGEAPCGDPEFGEAASDYAAAAMDPFDSSARATLSTKAETAHQPPAACEEQATGILIEALKRIEGSASLGCGNVARAALAKYETALSSAPVAPVGETETAFSISKRRHEAGKSRSAPVGEGLREALESAIELIQEAKGIAEPQGHGPVTDHLDFAQSCLNRAYAALQNDRGEG